MINLLQNSTVGDSIAVHYTGPGFYSGKPSNALNSAIYLEKVADVIHDKEDIYWFCKMNGYKIKPIKFKEIKDIPEHWETLFDSKQFQDMFEDDI